MSSLSRTLARAQLKIYKTETCLAACNCNRDWIIVCWIHPFTMWCCLNNYVRNKTIHWCIYAVLSKGKGKLFVSILRCNLNIFVVPLKIQKTKHWKGRRKFSRYGCRRYDSSKVTAALPALHGHGRHCDFFSLSLQLLLLVVCDCCCSSRSCPQTWSEEGIHGIALLCCNINKKKREEGRWRKKPNQIYSFSCTTNAPYILFPVIICVVGF